MKQTFRGGPGKVCYDHRHATDESYGSTARLIREHCRLPADDFKSGFHLEVGELDSDGYSLASARRHAYQMTSRYEPFGESSVDPRHGSEFLPSGSGMSGYPAPTYPEQKWVVEAARHGKVTLQ